MATERVNTVTENRVFIRDVLDDGQIRVDHSYRREITSGTIGGRHVADVPLACAHLFDTNGQRDVAELDDDERAWLTAEANDDDFLEVPQP